jgi:hypothetical protein
MFKRPLPTIKDTINVAIHDETNARYVFIIALVWPSSMAAAELYDGYKI